MKTTYNRQFARRQWRNSFINRLFWRNARHRGRDLSFRAFITNAPVEVEEAPAPQPVIEAPPVVKPNLSLTLAAS